MKHEIEIPETLQEQANQLVQYSEAMMESKLWARRGYNITQIAKAVKIAKANQRLEELRKELRAERISQGELLELQSLIPYIDKGDVELLEAAGVPEFDEELPSEDTYYIEYLNAAKRHARDKVEFASYEEAKEWGKANLENFNIDMIRIVNPYQTFKG